MPSAPVGSLGKIFKQCQKCHKTDDNLKSCARCRRSHYCSTECQRSDWQAHKSICNLNCTNRENMKQADADKRQEHPDQEALSLHDTASRLKKWVQVFKPPLQIAVINALHLQRTPEKCQTQLLNILVKPTFTTTSEASSFLIPHSFKVVDASVDSITESLKFPEFDELLATLSERSKAIRASGGIGVTFVAVRIEELGIMQITPFGLPDLLDDVPYDREWMASLKQIVAMGRVI